MMTLRRVIGLRSTLSSSAGWYRCDRRCVALTVADHEMPWRLYGAQLQSSGACSLWKRWATQKSKCHRAGVFACSVCTVETLSHCRAHDTFRRDIRLPIPDRTDQVVACSLDYLPCGSPSPPTQYRAASGGRSGCYVPMGGG
jgi:hypothetical protein